MSQYCIVNSVQETIEEHIAEVKKELSWFLKIDNLTEDQEKEVQENIDDVIQHLDKLKEDFEDHVANAEELAEELNNEKLYAEEEASEAVAEKESLEEKLSELEYIVSNHEKTETWRHHPDPYGKHNLSAEQIKADMEKESPLADLLEELQDELS